MTLSVPCNNFLPCGTEGKYYFFLYKKLDFALRLRLFEAEAKPPINVYFKTCIKTNEYDCISLITGAVRYENAGRRIGVDARFACID